MSTASSTASGARSETSHLGKSFRFKGEISGSEDIYIDGDVDGTIQLDGQVVTVGPHANVSAEVQARELIIHGKLKGNAKAQDRIEVSRTGSVEGDLAMARIAIQDGAFIQGRVDIRVPGAASPTTSASPNAPAPPISVAAVPPTTPAVAPAQSSFDRF